MATSAVKKTGHGRGRPRAETPENFHNHSLHSYSKGEAIRKKKQMGTLQQQERIEVDPRKQTFPREISIGPFKVRVTNCQHYRLYTITVLNRWGGMPESLFIGKQASMPDITQCLARMSEAVKNGNFDRSHANDVITEAVKFANVPKENATFLKQQLVRRKG